MTNEELKVLNEKLWSAADNLRANSGLKATEYSAPILGLIFLRFADSKYSKMEDDIVAEYNKLKSGRVSKELHEIAIEKCGFYIPQEARYDYLVNIPTSQDIAGAIKKAMEAIERYTPNLEGVLPKSEYYDIAKSENKEVLKNLLKTFKDIPDNVGLDIFGQIYEYFLGKFALAEGQGGGEFFTPSTVVRYMVEVLQPTEGKILDPACGSGGMFVQTAHYIERMKKKHGEDAEINLRAYGVEKTGATVNLAKMNLVLNNIRGEIREANSYYADPHDSYHNFDYVMANPPFNVKDVDFEMVKDQKRFNEFGIPQNKSKSTKKQSDMTGKVPNANYLWINQFATALKDNGRAALVMANGASTAKYSEQDIRERLVKSGIISQMVALPTNMFNTVTLPATLWFFDKSKINDESKKDKILFIDARQIFISVDRAHNKFSDEQIKNLAMITKVYRGDSEAYDDLIEEYTEARNNAVGEEADYWSENIQWLTNNFPKGAYQDVKGLCKVVKTEELSEDYSLNPGRYVGVEEDKEDEELFEEKMTRLTTELSDMFEKSIELQEEIKRKLGAIGYEL